MALLHVTGRRVLCIEFGAEELRPDRVNGIAGVRVRVKAETPAGDKFVVICLLADDTGVRDVAAAPPVTPPPP